MPFGLLRRFTYLCGIGGLSRRLSTPLGVP
nr:MAG TPA: hypothetical protein [Caudoviricetes sp.]